MLPDLDKPSLKEMGITLMGDMIAILRYAKKVSEEMTCERFLVDTAEPTLSINSSINNNNNKSVKMNPTKSAVTKKLPSKITNVTKVIDNKSQVISKNNLKTKSTVTLKKKPVGNTRVGSIVKADVQSKKRKLTETKIIDSDNDDSDDDDINLKINKRLKSDDSKINYKVVMGRTGNIKPQELSSKKKLIDQKRTVFDRLGDSSVTSTTNLIDTNSSPTFNVTGIGNDVVKRNSSVFNRLGDRDKKDMSAGILKNETSDGKLNQPHGILKSKPCNIGTTSISVVKGIKGIGKSGTMHADHETNKKIVSSSIKQLVRTTKAMKLNSVASITRKIPNNKLGELKLFLS